MDERKDPFDNAESGSQKTENSASTSATGIFGNIPAPASPSPSEDWFASLKQAPGVPPAGSTVADAESMKQSQPEKPADAAKPAGPGEFTRMLQSLKTPSADTPPQPTPSQDLANIFKQVSVDRNRAAEGAIFSPKSSAPPADAVVTPAVPQPRATEPAPAPVSAPGSFTSMFQSLGNQPAQQSTPAPQPAPVLQSAPQIAAAPGSQGAGEFTQFFKAVQETPPQAAAPAPPPGFPPQQGQKNEPGAFTQMFSRPATPPAQTDPAFPQLAQKNEPGPLTQMFSQPAAPPPSASAPGFPASPQKNDFWSATSAPSQPPPAQQGGGFTKLFQALNDEGAPARQAVDAPYVPSPPPAPAATSGPGGGFTQLFQTLGTEAPKSASAPLPYSPTQSTAPAPDPGGPGEYTRVISGSALRELRGSAPPPPPPTAPAPVTAVPAVFARPAIPAAPPVPSASPAPSHFAPQAFAFPPAPAPPAPAPAPAPSGLQKHLPLILLVNVFLLVAIVLILVFVLRHH